jgi:TatD DNase family protein
MTKSKNGIKIIKNIPANRLLLESESPFIGVNRESLIPVDINPTVREMTVIIGLPIPNLNLILKENFKNLII